MFMVIAGGGKVGLNLARELLEKGHELSLIEQWRPRYIRLERELEHVAQYGDATELWVLERAGIARADIDARYNLTADEFRVEGDLVVVGPLYADDDLGDLTEQLESLGLVYFDDFFEMSGNWPQWCRIFAAERRP